MNPEAQTLHLPTKDNTKKSLAVKARTRAASSAKRARKPKRHTQANTAHRGTKTAKILALLERQDGASLAELRKATGWQAHSVRGFLSGALHKKMGLPVASEKRADGERAYRISAK